MVRPLHAPRQTRDRRGRSGGLVWLRQRESGAEPHQRQYSRKRFHGRPAYPWPGTRAGGTPCTSALRICWPNRSAKRMPCNSHWSIAHPYRPSWPKTGLDASTAAQSGRIANPILSLERVRLGSETEIGRILSFGLLDLLTLPTRKGIAERRIKQTQLRLSSDVVDQVTQVRQSWVRAVAARRGPGLHPTGRR